MTKRLTRLFACWLVLYAVWPDMPRAQPAAPTTTAPATTAPAAAAQSFNTEQIDALLAPIALYPDALLTQTLMASTFPLEIVQAARWVEVPANKALTGDALTKALEAQPWDPSVKSLVPFPQVLATMNGNLDWTQQLGYAVADQQADVLDSVQRLRRQAQTSGNLQSTPLQVVRSEEQTIIIEPAQAETVYVPSYNPTVVYGGWPYPSYPPVYLPPPVGYPVGAALATGLAFGAGIAITAGLWNWARPVWGGGYGGGSINMNVNRYNNINANRGSIKSGTWQPNRAGGRPAGLQRPPGGPVGQPARSGGLPAGAIGRPQVSVPGNALRSPTRSGTGAGQGAGASRPQPGQGVGGARPGTGQIGNRPNAGDRPSVSPPIANRSPGAGARAPNQGAFGGMSDGRQAGQFGQRGGQSRSFSQQPRGGGGAVSRGGGGARGGGGGRGGGRR
jgi:Protein of unknown function (DUF3300)